MSAGMKATAKCANWISSFKRFETRFLHLPLSAVSRYDHRRQVGVGGAVSTPELRPFKCTQRWSFPRIGQKIICLLGPEW